VPTRLTQDRLKQAMVVKSILEERFPACFVKDGQSRKPLKIGIVDELVPLRDEFEDVSRNSIRNFLALYCSDPTYIEACLKPDAMRIDLAGTPVEPVSDEDKARAKASPRKVFFKEKQVVQIPKKPKPKKESKPAAKKPTLSTSKPAKAVPVVKIKRKLIRGPDGTMILKRSRVIEAKKDED